MTTHHYGWKRQGHDDRDWKFAPRRRGVNPPSLWLNMVPRDLQSNLGACGPNTSDEHWRFDQQAEGIAVAPVSRLFIYYATRMLMGTTGQDSGVDNRTMLKAMAQYGAPTESLWPYDISRFTVKPSAIVFNSALANRITSYAAVDVTLAAMKACLVAGRPFIFGFDVYQAIESDAVAATGRIPMPSGSPIGGHDILIWGYDDAAQEFTVTNHWDGWGVPIKGVEGCGTIPYAYAANSNYASDFWTINAVPGEIIVPPTPVPVPIPIPSPAPPPNIQAQIDAVFDKLIAANHDRPVVASAIRMVKQLVDNYLAQHPLGGMSASPNILPIVDMILVALEAKYPAWAFVIETVKSMIDAYLARG